MISTTSESPAWLASAAAWITPRRIRAHAAILALCLWGVAVADFASPGLFDRVGNIKFQDFLPFYVSARLIRQHRATELYDARVTTVEVQTILHEPTNVQLPYLYGPQVALLFTPLAEFSFANAAKVWVALSLLIFFGCIFLIWRSCPNLREYSGTILLTALAFPPLFHFFVRGQISALVLACFTAAFFAFNRQKDWLAGIALGFLIFKPQFLVAIPLVLLLVRAWKPLRTLVLSAAAQLAFARLYFGPTVMHAYFDTLVQPGRWIDSAELLLAPIQMHSLRSFWILLIPWPTAALTLYIFSSIAVIAIAASVWKSPSPLALRFSALIVAAVLVNPHLFVYDLLVLAPVLLLLADWSAANQGYIPALPLLLYLAFMLPLFGSLSQWSHIQLSVPVLMALLWILHEMSNAEHVAQGLRPRFPE